MTFFDYLNANPDVVTFLVIFVGSLVVGYIHGS